MYTKRQEWLDNWEAELQPISPHPYHKCLWIQFITDNPGQKLSKILRECLANDTKCRKIDTNLYKIHKIPQNCIKFDKFQYLLLVKWHVSTCSGHIGFLSNHHVWRHRHETYPLRTQRIAVNHIHSISRGSPSEGEQQNQWKSAKSANQHTSGS